MKIQNLVIALLLLLSIYFYINSSHIPTPCPECICDTTPCESSKKMEDLLPDAADSEQDQTKAEASTTETPQPPTNNITTPNPPSLSYDKIVDWRVGAISKLVTLSDEQKERLKAKFVNEQTSGASTTESLEDILGRDNLNIYEESRSRARAKVKGESLEKEVLYIARRLELDSNSEEILRSIIYKADQEVEEYLSEQKKAYPNRKDPYQNFLDYIESLRIRREIIRDNLKNQIENEKFEEYLKLESESAALEIELWHGN